MNSLLGQFQRLCIKNPRTRGNIHSLSFHGNFHTARPRGGNHNGGASFALNARTFTNSSNASSPRTVNHFKFGSWWVPRAGTAGASVLSAIGLGVGLAVYTRPVVQCEAPPQARYTKPSEIPELPPLPSVPQSSLKLYELGFGTVTGICAGVFIKKGAKAIAFVVGGVFVLLQYFASLRIIRVDWARAETQFADRFYSKSVDASGKEAQHPPTAYALIRWLIDFLTADFPPRATFIAGLALGLRIG